MMAFSGVCTSCVMVLTRTRRACAAPPRPRRGRRAGAPRPSVASSSAVLHLHQRGVGGLARLHGLAVQARVVHRHGRAAGQVLGHHHVDVAEAPVVLGGDEGHGAQHVSPRHHRHDDVRADPQLAQQLQVLLVVRRGHQRRVGHVEHHLRPPGADDPRRADQVAGAGRILRVQRARGLLLVGDRDARRRCAAPRRPRPARPRCTRRPGTAATCRPRW